MKWLAVLRVSFRDVFLMGFGGWVIWKEVYATNPSGTLALIGFACMVPSARHAIISILSEPGPSSESQQHPPAQSSESSRQEGTGDRK